MTEMEHSPAATPCPASGHAPDIAAELTATSATTLQPLTRASLNALCDAGVISPAAWRNAVDFCGFRPDGKAWPTYWRQMFLLGGALFLLAGVICFIAWNWAAMPPLARMALTGAVVAGSGIGSVLLGPDTRLGKVLLLACGIAMGPMLAVFGQTYQTGAELWELFRVWTALLVLLALAGRQAGLWFAAWISANIFAALWLGRNLASPLDALWQLFTVPEWLLAIACAVVCWEWAARRAACGPADRGADAAHAWLYSRWMPRLLFFDMVSRTAFFLIVMIFSRDFGAGHQLLWLPPKFVAGFSVGMAGLSWWWYRTRQPDLFMLAMLLAAGVVVLLAALADAELFFNSGTMLALFLWGLLVTAVTAGLAKTLLYLQRGMSSGRKHKYPAPPTIPSFLGRTVAGVSWESLWAHLQGCGVVSLSAPLPGLQTVPSPWYVRGLLAVGGWLAAALFIGFFCFLLFASLQISSNEELAIFITSLPVLLAGRVLLARRQLFARNFGFAMALAGTAGIAVALCASVTPEALACFALAAVLLALGIFMRSAGYAWLAAVGIGNSAALGLAFFYGHAGGFAPPMAGGAAELISVWWAVVCAGLAYYCLREEHWRCAGRGPVAEAWFYGFYISLLIFQLCALGVSYGPGIASDIGLPGMGGHLGLGAALAIAVLAFFLSKGASRSARLPLLAGMPLVFALAWYLPGAVLALLGLTLARQLGSVVMQGFVLAYLFGYMVFYYYSLAVPFSFKSVSLIAAGLGLLALALILRVWQAKAGAEEAGHA